MSENEKTIDPQTAFVEKVLKMEEKRQLWGNIFKVLIGTYLVATTAMFAFVMFDESGSTGPDEKHIAVVDVKGEIKPDNEAYQKIASSIKEAYENENTEAVVLRINSPGGSPVQSNKLYSMVKRLKAEHSKPTYSIISDIAASGGYYVSLAGDEIYANRSSLVGSIGVILSIYNVQNVAEKLGVSKTNLVTGSNKDIGDPFKEMTSEQQKLMMASLNDVFEEFKSTVKESRGDKLDYEHPELFSGMIWSGKAAAEFGLIDGFTTLREIKEKYGVDHAVLYNRQTKPLLPSLLGIDVLADGIVANLSNQSITIR